MWRATDKEIDRRLSIAEKLGSCLVSWNANQRRALDARVRKGLLVSPMPRLYARASTWDSLDPAERHLYKLYAINDLHPDWVFCGISAAVAHGFSVGHARIGDVEVASTRGRKSVRGSGVRWRYVRDEEPAQAAWLPVTQPLRTVFDCIRQMDFRDGLALADSALHRGSITKDELMRYVAQMRNGFAGIEQARMTAAHASPLPESGGESIARAVMLELGFAAPELQVLIPDPMNPGRTYRADFRWTLDDGTVILGELDGGEKYLNPAMNGGSAMAALRRERLRESRLTVNGARVMRFSLEDVYDLAYFSRLLEAFGVPRDHEPLVSVPDAPMPEQVPVEAYGLD